MQQKIPLQRLIRESRDIINLRNGRGRVGQCTELRNVQQLRQHYNNMQVGGEGGDKINEGTAMR